MFLQLGHTKLKVYAYSENLVLECYKVTRSFPSEERFALVLQIRRAANSVHLNIAEGCSGKSTTERKRFFGIARGSLIEIDSAIGIAFKLGYIVKEELDLLGDFIITTFKLLSGMIASSDSHD